MLNQSHSKREKYKNILYLLEHADRQIIGNFLFSQWRYFTHESSSWDHYDVDFLRRIIRILESKYTEEGPVIIKENARIEEYYEGLKLWNDMPIEVLYTPGHSDDSVCFIIDNMLFTGDTLIKNVRTVTKLKSGSKEKLNETLRQIEKFKGQSLMVYPGHEEIFALDVYDLRNSSEMLVASIANIKN